MKIVYFHFFIAYVFNTILVFLVLHCTLNAELRADQFCVYVGIRQVVSFLYEKLSDSLVKFSEVV